MARYQIRLNSPVLKGSKRILLLHTLWLNQTVLFVLVSFHSFTLAIHAAFSHQGREGAGADPSRHWARGGVHLGQVAA